MATTAHKAAYNSSPRINVSRIALTTALAATAFFVLCWIGGLIGFGPASHMYVQLFSTAEVTSTTALLFGLCYSLFGGLIAGALFGFAYNALSFLDRG
jgi:hypothetical protein